jgi:hypothetical protein
MKMKVSAKMAAKSVANQYQLASKAQHRENA